MLPDVDARKKENIVSNCCRLDSSCKKLAKTMASYTKLDSSDSNDVEEVGEEKRDFLGPLQLVDSA